MKVKCIKAISYTTGEDLGSSSPWVKPGSEYLVLAVRTSIENGVEILLTSDDHNQLILKNVEGLEFIGRKIPSSWIMTEPRELYSNKWTWLIPASWSHEGFLANVEDGDPQALEVFFAETQKMYEEEGWMEEFVRRTGG